MELNKGVSNKDMLWAIMKQYYGKEWCPVNEKGWPDDLGSEVSHHKIKAMLKWNATDV